MSLEEVMERWDEFEVADEEEEDLEQPLVPEEEDSVLYEDPEVVSMN